MQMAAINRKQVPLCAEHHYKVHGNDLSAKEKTQYSFLIKQSTRTNPKGSVTKKKLNKYVLKDSSIPRAGEPYELKGSRTVRRAVLRPKDFYKIHGLSADPYQPCGGARFN